MNASSVCLSESPALRRRGPERQFRFIREPQLRHTSRGKRAGFLALTLALLTATHGLCSTNVTFAPGAYIIDMGVVPQTAANGLKPYGLIYSLVTSNTASVYWAINPNKVTDKNPTVTVEGIDFSLNGKSYRGGPFIIAAEDINPTISGLITTWRAKGVKIDGPITNSFSAPVYDIITSFPNVVLDTQNGKELITSFYTPAEVPTTSYRLGLPPDLAPCDDVYGMPHADPQYWDAATRAGLLNFIRRGGCVWASCHAVSALEALPPTYVGDNFLSAVSLVPFGSHLEQNPTPLAYNTNDPSIWTEPLMQFMGKIDLSLQGGSEVVYVPDSQGWAPHAKVAAFNKFYTDSRQPWISHTNPYMAAADVVFGRAYNNPNYGLIMYVSSHTFQADGVDENTAVGRLYGNMVLRTGIQRRPRVILNCAITTIRVGESTAVTAAITGNGGPYSIVWNSSDGTFSNPTATNTTFTAFTTAQPGESSIYATVSDTCNSRTFSSVILNLLPASGPSLYKTASWTNSPGPAQAGDQINYQIKMGNFTNQAVLTGARITDFLPPNTTYKAASASPPLSSGPDPLVWLLGTNAAEIPGVVGAAVSNNFSATTNTFDTYLDNQNKDRNYGGATTLTISGNANHEKRTLVRFDLSTIPSNATIASASLILTKTGGTATAARNISLHRLTNDWTENTLNNANGDASWNQRNNGVNWAKSGGDFAAARESSNTVGTANGPYTWDVTAAIQSAKAAPGRANTNGFLLRYNYSKLPNDTMIFGSSENAGGNGPKLVVLYSAGVGTTTRISASSYRLIGSQNSLPTLDVLMQVTVTGNPTNLTVAPPANLTVTASAGATATKQGGYPSPASAIVPAGGGTVIFTYKYDITSLGTAPGSLIFSGQPANAGGATYATATASSILTVPALNYSVLVNAPLPPLVQQIPNTATFSDNLGFQIGTNEVNSTAIVPVSSSSPNIGLAKGVTSIVNLADGRYAVTFDFAVTNLGSLTLSNVQVADNLNAGFLGKPLTGISLTATPGLAVNPGYNGISVTNLLVGTNTLLAGAGGRISLAVTVAAGSTLSYTNQARASATDLSGTLGTTDLSDNGTNPDSNGNGDPTEAGENDPTPVLFSEHPVITVSKDLASLVKNTNNTFTLSYSIQVANAGDVNLLGVQVSDKLTTVFPAPATFVVNSLSSSDFTVNGSYNGNSNTNLLAASQSLAAGAQGVINLTLTVNRNGGAVVNFTNQANGSATSPASQSVAGSGSALAVLEVPALTVTKQVTALVPSGTNFSVSMRIDVKNSGDVTLTNVQATDDLDSTFSGVQSFTITSKTASGLTINTNYDGVADINLLTGLNSLSVGTTGSVFLTVRVIPGLGTTFGNQASASGTSTNINGETVTGQSAQVPIVPSLVQGTIYLDHNTNGVLDAGDYALPYVDILITTSSNTTVTVTSDVLGHYVALVPSGSTIINVNELDPQFPTNVSLTVGSTDPTTNSVPAGGSVTVDKGYVLASGKGVVAGYLFLDNDGDGLYDTFLGDAPIPNVNVQVIDKNGVTNTVTTDINGYFLKTVPSGQAIVKVFTADPDFPVGVVLTVDDFDNGSDPTMVTVPDGGVATDTTGYVTPDAGSGEVFGIVYLDRNTNGVFDVADSPLAGINVTITDTNGIVTVVPTDVSGFFSLIVDPGLTIVNVLTNDSAFPAGATVTVGTTNPATVNVADGGAARSDKGFRLPTGNGIIQGVLYIDNNNDGIYEVGVDTPIPDITINVTATNGVVIPVVTDANGAYTLLLTNGITVVTVDTSDPDFPAELSLTTDSHGEGHNPASITVPNGGSATVNVGYTPVNHFPSPANDTAYTKENVPVGGNVLLNDLLGDTPISSLTIAVNPSHGAAVLNFDGSYTYTPAPGYYGSDSFVYQLCDANNDCATAQVTITVNSVPFAINDTVSFNENTLLASSVATNDIPSGDGGNVWTLLATAAHGVVSFNPNGTYSYQPATNYFGSDTFSYKLCDVDADCSTGMVSITVIHVNQTPVANNQSVVTPEDTATNLVLTATDVDSTNLTYAILAGPTNGIISGFNTNTGALLYTPATNYNGLDTFTFTVFDGGLYATGTVTITVTPVNDAPLASNQTVVTPEDTSTNLVLIAADVDSTNLVFSILIGPTNGVISGFNTNTGALLYTPATNYYGSDSFTFIVCDGSLCTTGIVSITVTPVNDAPVANNQSVTTPEDTATNIVVTATDLDSTNLTYAILAGPTNGVISGFDTNTGALLYTPATNYNGLDSFTFTVFDGSLYATGAVSITVTPVNDLPIAVDDVTSTPKNTPVLIPVLVNDSDVDGDVLTIIGASPTNGAVSIVGTNLLFTPASNYVGIATIGYTINDGHGGTASALVTIFVTLGTNTPPLAVDDTATIAEDTVLTIDPRTNDSDTDGDPLTITGATTTNGTVVVVGGTNLVFTPATNFNGTATVHYTISDGLGGTASANVVVTVTPVNDAPVANDQNVATPEDTAKSITVTGSDVDSTNLTYAILVGPTNGAISSFNAATGALLYTPATNYNGPDAFTFTVSDGSLQATGLVSITVTPVNDAPAANDQNVVTPEDTATNIVLTATDVDSTNLTYAILAGPTNGVITGLTTNTGALTYIPATNYNGLDSFTFTVFDGSLYATGTVSITVTPVNDPPVAVDDTTSTPKNTSVLIAVLANDSDVDGDVLTIIGASPTNGAVSIVGTNLLFTPASNYVGTATIGYTISDGHGGTASAMVTIFVTLGTNTPPVAVDDTATIAEDTVLTIDPRTNDSDTDGDPLTITGATTTNGTVIVVGGTNLVFTPATDFDGTATVHYTISDGMGGTASANVVVTVTPVNDAPVAYDQIVTTPEDTATNLVLLASDVDNTNLVFSILIGPTNGAISGFNTNTGALLYTPTTNYNGPDSLVFTVFDGSLYATGMVSITVTPVNDGPVANNQSVATPEDTPKSIVVTGNDVDSANLTFGILVGPTNGAISGFNPSTGALLYTPATNYNGPDSFTFTVFDGSLYATGMVNITVTPVNDAPIAYDQNVVTPEDTATNIVLTATDVDSTNLTYAVLAAPTNGLITGLNTNTGALTYTPAINYNGLDSFTFTVFDGSLYATGTVSITVTPVNDPPVAVDDSTSTPRNTAVLIPVLVNDSDVDGDALTIIDASPTNGAVSIVGTNLLFTPASNYVGIATIGYTISDSHGGTATALVTVFVTLGTNTPPVAVDDTATTPEDTVLTIDPRGNDYDLDGDPLTIIGATATNGSVIVVGGTNLVFTPATNFNGTATVHYTISDGMGGTASANVVITVTPVNDAPVAYDQDVTTPEDTAANLVLIASDVDSTNLVFSILVGPTNGGISGLNTNTGALLYTPTTNFYGPDGFTFTVCDGSLCATGIVSITVTPVNDAPIADDQNVTTPEDTAKTIFLTGSDVDSTNLVFAILSSPTNGAITGLNPGNWSLIYTPAPNYYGPDSFQFTVFDGSLYATGLVSITVTPVNDAPIANDQNVVTPEDTATNIVLTATDVDSTNLTFAILDGPTNGVVTGLNTNIGALTYTPATNYNGLDSFTFTVFDGSLYSTGTVSITVTPLNDPPIAVDDTATTPEDTAVTIPVLANDSDADGDMLTITLATTTNGIVSIVGTNLVFTPATNFNGIATINYTISDGHGGTASALVTVTVTPINNAPVANNQSVTTPEDTSKNIVVTGSDVDSTNLTYAILVNPTNGTISGFDTATGALLYTPSTNYNGPDSFTFTVSDGSLQATGRVSITVTPVNDAPVAVDDVAFTRKNTAVTIRPLVNDYDLDGDKLTIISVSPTNGTASIIGGTNVLFRPKTNFTGIGYIRYTIGDGNGGTASALITVNITNRPPVAVNDFAATRKNTPKIIRPLNNDSDPDGDKLTVISVSPTNGIASIIGGTNVLFSPATNFVGLGTIGYTISDSKGGFASALISINVTNRRPVAVNDVVGTPRNIPVTIAPLANDSDPDHDVLTVISVSPTNGTASIIGGTNVLFTPTADFQGVAHVGYTMSDGYSNASALITINVTNRPPVALNDTTSTLRNIAVTVSPLVNDSDPDGDPLTITTLHATNGTASIVSVTNVLFTPDPEFAGTGTVRYTINDGHGGTTSALITINVANQPPVAVDDTASTIENTPVTIKPLLNDSDPDGDNLTIVSVSPTNGTATIVGGTNVVFKPKTNFLGTAYIGYTITDGYGATASAVITVEVSASADVLVFKNGPASVHTGSNVTFTITVTNHGPSTASNIVVYDQLPAGFLFVSATPTESSVSNNLVAWPTFNLGNHKTTNLHVTARARGSGGFTNIAFSTSDTPDPNPANNDGSSPRSRVSITVTTNAPAASFGIFAGTNVFNPQTGLFEQRVVVTNNGSGTAAAVRLLVGGLRSGVVLYNASGTNGTRPYVQYNAPLNPGQTVTFRLEFYVADRHPFSDTLEAQAVLPAIAQTNSGSSVYVDKTFIDSRIPGEPRFVIEWASIPGRTYTVIYSSDLRNWTAATPSITANANRTQWYDDGPPKTISLPSSGVRYYKVILAPANP